MDFNQADLKAVALRVLAHFKTQAEVARVLGYSDRRNVTNWVKGVQPFPPMHCTTIHRATKGEIARWDLRPFDWWLIWPELVGADGAPECPTEAVTAEQEVANG